MIAKLRAGFALWLSMGPVAGTRAAVEMGRRLAAAPGRRWRLRLAPLRVSPEELSRALGSVTPAAALAGARDALPPWEPDEGVLARAKEVAAHRFDLLGSGPTDLGPRIDWQRDFKSGRSWPMRHISEAVISYPDGSDIKVPWELSRFQHLPLLAAAHRVTGDERWVAEMRAQLLDWIETNPVEFGANWACTMDVAIRAANWTAALALLDEETLGAPWVAEVAASLLLHGRFIRSHLEWGEARGNHYLADVAGLLVVAAVFRRSPEGADWARWAADALAGEMEHQVRADGVDHEASIPYHRLVAELFVCGARAADAVAPGRLGPAFWERLDAMLRFTADVERPDGLAPSVGDDDSGRFLPLGDYGRDPRDHRHLFAQAEVARPAVDGHAAYPAGGYWVMRGGELWALVRCGDVGIHGRGCHAHNDALSFELAFGGRPLVVDPGSYLYTADPVERTRFRSAAVHATVQVDGAEPNPLSEQALFALEDRARAECVAWEPGADGRAMWAGRHHGFAVPVQRRLRFDGPAGELVVADTAEGDLSWCFPLAQPDSVEVLERGARAGFGDVVLEISADRDVSVAVEDGWLSPAYGVRVPTSYVRLRAPGPREITLRARRP